MQSLTDIIGKSTEAEDDTNSKAVERIYKLKQRDDTKNMLVLLDDVGKIASYADVPDIALELIEMSDKPLTIIYPNAKGLSPALIGADKTVGIRITREEFSKSLLFRLNRPLVSTSANVSGQPAPTCFADISDDIKKNVDYMVDFRKNETKNPPPFKHHQIGNERDNTNYQTVRRYGTHIKYRQFYRHLFGRISSRC
ncbi:hypothetical protein FACS1894199_15770 [Bacteroidia bacterium]|nr:hypothetical protein FACS1894199_15770 [Bacteroidia bacterium]